MKNEITIPVPKEEDFVAANMRRDQYAIKRDLQAAEYNRSITSRLLAEKSIPVKCHKCGKEFTPGIDQDDASTCDECR